MHLLAAVALAGFKSRAALQLENLALRHQLGVLHRSVKKPRLTSPDRLLWAWLCVVWNDWRSALVIVKPQTVIAWHRKGFRLFWQGKILRGQPGRPQCCQGRSPTITKSWEVALLGFQQQATRGYPRKPCQSFPTSSGTTAASCRPALSLSSDADSEGDPDLRQSLPISVSWTASKGLTE